jgi:hypothetical protein
MERDIVAGQLQSRGVEIDLFEWQNFAHFEQTFRGARYDLLYLSSHATVDGFGNNPWENPWSEFAQVICSTDCMHPEAVLFLACCRGGLKTLALNMLSVCNKIDYIVGPVWKAKGGDITNAFRAFCECCYSKKDGTREAPCKIAQCLSEAGGQAFACYDRIDMEGELEMFRRLRCIDEQVRTNYLMLNELRTIAVSNLAERNVIRPQNSA